MFGIDINQAKQIAEGWTNDLLGREQELSESRMKICRECPIYNPDNDRCDGKRGINTKTGELVKFPGKDVVMGCNCIMNKKTKVPSAKCVLSRWEQ